MPQLIIVWLIIFLPTQCFYLGIFIESWWPPFSSPEQIFLRSSRDLWLPVVTYLDSLRLLSLPIDWFITAVSFLQHWWFELTFIDPSDSFLKPFWFDPLQDYVLVQKWPLLQPTVQFRRSEHPVASVSCQNSDVWVTSFCSVVLLCLPLDPSSIRILSGGSYLYFSIFSAVIYYYCFDLQRNIYHLCVDNFISFMHCVIVLTVNFASIMIHTHYKSINLILCSSFHIKCVIHIQ